MVEWRPLMGTIPPISEQDWLDVFEKYKAYPEYQKLNKGMSMDEFKFIFAFEYGHRVLGRVIGLVFALPALFFILKGAVPRSLIPKLVLLFLLGGAQGVIGWWMVKSGLVDRPDVSHYRLTTHLGMAVSLYIALLWIAFSHWKAVDAKSNFQSVPGHGFAKILLGMVFLVLLSGGLVAGLNAGHQFNTFPLMAGHLIPPGLFSIDPWYMNFFENMLTLQFNHRYFAILTASLVIGFWFYMKKRIVTSSQRLALNTMLVAVLLQVSLGITTLLTVVWVPVASMHQMGAIFLLSALIWVNTELSTVE